MAVTSLGLLGSNTATSAGTTLAVSNSTGSVIPSGTLIHLTGAWDNINTVTAPTITCSTIGGATATANHATPVGSGVTTTAGAGIWHTCFRALTTADIAVGATIATLTSNQSAVKRAAHAQGASGALPTLRGTVNFATSISGSAPVATTGTAPAVGDVVIGSAAFENSSAMTAATGTTGGSWTTVVGVFTSGGQAATNIGTGSQIKIITAAGAQSFNPVSANDTVTCVYALQPMLSATADFTGSGTLDVVETGRGYSATAAFSSTGTLTAEALLPTIDQAAYQFLKSTNGEAGEFCDGYSYENRVTASLSMSPTTQAVGQSFQGNGLPLTAMSFYMSKSGAPTGTTVTAKLYAHTGPYGEIGDIPTGSPLAASTTTVLATTLPVSPYPPLWQVFEFDGTFTLDSATVYFAVVEGSGLLDSSNSPGVRYESNIGTHPGRRATFNGTVWQSTTPADLVFQVLTGSGALAAQDTGYAADTSGGDVNLQLRPRLQSTTAANLTIPDSFQLQWEKNASGTWTDVYGAMRFMDSAPFVGYAGFAASLSPAAPSAAQAFVGNGEKLRQVTFMMNRSVSQPDGPVTAVLYDFSGPMASGVPVGAALTSSTPRPVADFATTSSQVSFDFDSTFTLVNGTVYAIGLLTTTTVNSFSVNTHSGVQHPGRGCTMSSAGVWTGLATSNDLLFELFTDPATAPSVVVPYSAPNLIENQFTTNRLPSGTGAFVSGKVVERGVLFHVQNWTGNNYTELLFAFTLRQADFSDGDTLRLRVVHKSVGSSTVTYSKIPTVTIGAGAGTTPVTKTQAVLWNVLALAPKLPPILVMATRWN